MTDTFATDPPSPFVARCIPRLAQMLGRGARALDYAAGRGRHTRALADAGFRVTAIDWRLDTLQDLVARAPARSPGVTAVCADLTLMPLPSAAFDLIVVCRYLDRERLPSLRQALRIGGVLVYETFTERQLQYAYGPRSRAHLLAPGELRLAARGMDVLFDEEVTEPEAVARIVARRRPER